MLKRNWSLTGVSLAAIIFYAVCGLLLLLLPTEALAIANYAIAALLLVMGVVCIIGYFRGSVIIGQFGFLLAVGMVLVTLAVVMFCYPTLLASLLPVIWGTSLLIGGFGKIQFAADLRRFGDRRWWTLLLGALLSFALGILCLANPIYIAQTIFVFIGICLLAEAVLDLVTLLMVRRHLRRFEKAMEV